MQVVGWFFEVISFTSMFGSELWDGLDDLVENVPVLLDRYPCYHRLGFLWGVTFGAGVSAGTLGVSF